VNEKQDPLRRARILRHTCVAAMLLDLAIAPSPTYAVRSNMVKDIPRMEELGQYQQALFYRKSTMDMVLALHVPWAGAPYDPEMDGFYRELDRIYGTGQRTQHQLVETRVDRRYWGIVNHQKRAIANALKKAGLTAEQLEKLDDRVRVFIEDHMAPEFGEMGDFFFQPKAQIMERTGLFWDASFLRRLNGYYMVRVCVPYYATTAEELDAKGKRSLAAAYRNKAKGYEAQALREFRRSNGDRLLSELQDAKRPKCLAKPQVVELLKAGLASKESDARFAAVLTLAQLEAFDDLGPATRDPDAELRREAEAILSQRTPKPPAGAAGLRQGIRACYYSAPAQQRPVAEKILRQVDLGFRGNDRFLPLLVPHWHKEEIFPPDARGQFLLKLAGKLSIPRDDRYRFYAKTDGGTRITLRLRPEGAEPLPIIASPQNDKELLYADQANWGGGTICRIDFSKPVELKKGLVDLDIDYRGGQVHNPYGKAGLRLYWSSDSHVMEIVPPAAFFCLGDERPLPP